MKKEIVKTALLMLGGIDFVFFSFPLDGELCLPLSGRKRVEAEALVVVNNRAAAERKRGRQEKTEFDVFSFFAVVAAASLSPFPSLYLSLFLQMNLSLPFACARTGWGPGTSRTRWGSRSAPSRRRPGRSGGGRPWLLL